MVAFNPPSKVLEFLQIAVPRINYRDSEAVKTYLENHPQITDFLETVWPTLTMFFGQSINVDLEILTYPDESGKDELVGWIQYVDRDIERGLDILEEFEEEIFEKQIELVGNSFNFNIEFK